ncbi:MAG: type II toxin-antitoxin system HicB family antitoxin [Lachnospiraceae bacterium]|jgi:predicted RNase H-like HicB family nuclease|nr:type II toxin-antitoxin system HicB family antitoxin [Lachnospiraceae bacterium]
MTKYTYPAVFTTEKDGGYSVDFPDIPGCYSCGDTLADAIYMAEDALAFTLYGYEQEKRAIPTPSNPSDLVVNKNEFVNYVACDTLVYRKRHNNRAVKKTLTIPEWLNERAVEMGLNFSQVLQEALMQRIEM